MTTFPCEQVSTDSSVACAVAVAGAPGRRPGKDSSNKGQRSPRRPRRNTRSRHAGPPLLRRAVASLACCLWAFVLSFVAPGAALATEAILPDPNTNASLTIHKYELPDDVTADQRADGTQGAATEVPAEAEPLEGIEFELTRLYSKGEIDALVSRGDAKRSDYVAYEGKGVLDDPYFVKQGSALLQARTEQDGTAFIDLTGAQGTYLVRELPDPRVEKPCEPFLVNVPMQDPINKGAWLYDVHIYPKNYGIDVDKVILKDEVPTMHDSVSVGELVTFKVSCDVPSDAARLQSFTMTDVLDYRLTIHGDLSEHLSVAVGETTLTPVEDYTCEIAEDKDEQGHGRQTLLVDLTAGLEKLQQAYEVSKTPGSCKVGIIFTCRLNSYATSGTLANQAVFDITNEMGNHHSHLTPIPHVSFAQINIMKLDARDEATALAGARFRIAASADDAQQGRWISKLEDNGSDAGIWEVETDDQGQATFPGLRYDLDQGTDYYLVESTAPAGYSPLTEPIRVHVGPGQATQDVNVNTETTVQNDNASSEPDDRPISNEANTTYESGGVTNVVQSVDVDVFNTPLPELPFTGGDGSGWRIAAGAASITAAMALLAFVTMRGRRHGGN